MEVNFTLWSLRSILNEIPFDSPVTENTIHLDFSKLAIPYYLKNGFKVSILYQDDSFPVDAVCSIYSPKSVVTVIFIIKRKYEESLSSWLAMQQDNSLEDCCRRRELYCHEVSHLIAIIRAYPSDRSSKVREDFIEKLKKKFEKSINSAEKTRSLQFISMEKADESPSDFDRDHFHYGDDRLNYFKLFQDLMLPYDKMIDIIESLGVDYIKVNGISFQDVMKNAYIAKTFFKSFPEKLMAFQELLAEKVVK